MSTSYYHIAYLVVLFAVDPQRRFYLFIIYDGGARCGRRKTAASQLSRPSVGCACVTIILSWARV